MKKFFFLIITCLSFASLFAQEEVKPVTSAKKYDLSNRPGDHFMIQLTSDHWTGMPDSIASHQSGFSRGLNAYLMLDKPFKTDSRLSFAIGIGIGSSNIIFKKMNVDLKANSVRLPFTHVDSTNHFKNYKLSLSYLEIPVEFRFSSNPADPGKSWKFALGLKGGTLINAHTKGKELQNKNNQTINSYTEKENSKKYFNGTRFMGTARIGYGIFSLYGGYQLGNVLKDVAGPPMRLYEIGISLSGL